MNNIKEDAVAANSMGDGSAIKGEDAVGRLRKTVFGRLKDGFINRKKSKKQT